MNKKIIYSLNQLTGKKYLIPNKLDDKKNINKFLSINPRNKVVAVQGLGFVGAVMSIVCANSKKSNYSVIGVDLADKNNYWKIASINDGVFPLIASDPKIDVYFEKAKQKRNFYATYDPYSYSKADIIIVDINLDVIKKSNFKRDLLNFDVDLTAFKKSIETIGKYCKEDALILVETTVPPGTCEKVVKPIIVNKLIERGCKTNKIKIGHSYERVMPGPNYVDSIKNFYRVFSGINEVSSKSTEKFLKTIISTKKYPLTKLGNTNSTEYAKVLENSYRAMNISFATEWSRYAEESNVNMYEVVDAIRMRPTHNNLMYPGIGVGGYCLTKDPLLASWAKKNHFNSNQSLDQSINGVETNDKMPLFAYSFLKKTLKMKSFKNKRILLLGISYRGDVGDTRFSPVEYFYKYFKKDKAEITLHDPYIKYWDELNLKVEQNLKNCFNSKLDFIIISCGHSLYKSSKFLINKLINLNNLIVYDTIGILTNKQIEKVKNKNKVIVLGRGDV